MFSRRDGDEWELLNDSLFTSEVAWLILLLWLEHMFQFIVPQSECLELEALCYRIDYSFCHDAAN